jgi:predicted N-acetyltransferase YhbS
MFQILPSQGFDLPEIDVLLDAAFGPARRNRTAYRLRDGAAPDPALSFIARDGAAMVGSVQCWPIRLRAADGRMLPMVLLGPVVTDAARRGEGIASALIETALAVVDGGCKLPVLLIGDAPFYDRFGFCAAATGGWIMPGPVDRARLLLRWTGAPLPLVGWVEGKDGLRRAA